jgi:hypothetical protein
MNLSKGRQFPKGKSGNPRGRPKGSRNWNNLVLEELKKKVEVKEDGQPKKLHMAELLIKGLIRECLSGNPSAISLLLTYFPEAHSEVMVFRLQMGKDLSEFYKNDLNA